MRIRAKYSNMRCKLVAQLHAWWLEGIVRRKVDTQDDAHAKQQRTNNTGGTVQIWIGANLIACWRIQKYLPRVRHNSVNVGRLDVNYLASHRSQWRPSGL